MKKSSDETITWTYWEDLAFLREHFGNKMEGAEGQWSTEDTGTRVCIL